MVGRLVLKIVDSIDDPENITAENILFSVSNIMENNKVLFQNTYHFLKYRHLSIPKHKLLNMLNVL